MTSSPIPRTVEHEAVDGFAAAIDAIRIRANEAAIDDALLNLARVREQLVGLDMRHAACRVDEAIEAVEDKCRAVFRRRQLVEVSHDRS